MDEKVWEDLSLADMNAAVELWRKSKAEPDAQTPQAPQVDPAKQLDEAEAQEVEALRQRGVVGMSFATSRAVIRDKYTALRNQQPAPVDPEIEKARKDGTLGDLWKQRRRAIESRKDLPTVTKLRLNSELEAQFRKAGLK